MSDTDAADSTLEAAAGAAGPHAVEAFGLLGNGTRLAILLALWEAYEPESDNVLPFSALYEQVDYDNAGNFSYHLDRLDGHFIRKRPEGYELRKTGLELVKTVIAGAGMKEATLEPAEIDRECGLCGGATAVTYEDGVLYHVCTECAGFSSEHDLKDGYLNAIPLHPAGLTDRSPDELIAAAEVTAYRHMRTMFHGLCGTCSGPVDASLECCTDHDADGSCANCGRMHACWAHFQCRVCKDHHVTTPGVLSVFHPGVVAFYYDHGVSTRWNAETFDDLAYVGEREPETTTRLVSEDPPWVEVTIALDGDEISLTFDESVAIVDVRR